MIHVLIAVGIAGVIIGSTITLTLVAFMMGAHRGIDDREADWEGLQETLREWQPLGYRIKIWMERKARVVLKRTRKDSKKI